MPHDETYLYYMLAAARRIVGSTRGISPADFNADPEKRDSVAMQILNIGEAASRISEQFRTDHPEVPWHKSIGMRHRIVHAYMKIDWEIVWDSALRDIPDLITLLEPLVPSDYNE
jgi:uncharacterized protein with HEPN domain